MASLPRTSTVSQTSSPSTSHRERDASEPTENAAFIPDEGQALPSLIEEHGPPYTSPKVDITRKPVSPKDITSESVTSIVGGFFAGVALAIGHHIFLTFLNGRNIEEYPQYWVKNANNAFSAMFSMCIAFVATCALIQMKWRVAKSKPLSIRSIDNLFALPSPGALFTSVTLTRLRLLRLFLFPIFTAAFIQSVTLVSVFAPNALTVARSAQISGDLRVQTLDLSSSYKDGGSITSTSTDWLAYTSASPLWSAILTSIMLQPPILNWKIPAGCGAMCKFDLVYDGPGLQCMDTPLEPLKPLPPTVARFPLVYHGTSTLYPNPGNHFSSAWETQNLYELQIAYIATDHIGYNTERDGGSVHCVFRNATYKASFQVENNTMEVNPIIQSYGGILGTIRYGDSDTMCSQNITTPCFFNGVNTRAICEVFASAWTGKIQFNTSFTGQVREVTGGINVAVMDLLFSHGDLYRTDDFRLAATNFSESLVSLFSNLVFGFIPYRNDTTTVQAEIWDGSYAWSYTVWILWAVYLPTLLLASLVVLKGLLSIHLNKRGMDDRFSNFLLTTRDTELDVACMDAEDFTQLQQLHLLYQKKTETFVVASGSEYTK